MQAEHCRHCATPVTLSKGGTLQGPDGLSYCSKAPNGEPSHALEPETEVVFRRWRKSEAPYFSDVLALFPLLPETRPGTCVSYAHVGQHSAADYAHVISETEPAQLEDEDVQALKRELERIGYRLRVRARAPHWSRVTAARIEAGL